MEQYFKGERQTFDLCLAPEGTDFQKQVWKALQEIPYGETTSYSAIAKKIGRPRACRAVGGANGKNPICVVIPCHRVIGAGGQLAGFTSGISFKQWLLGLEGKTGPPPKEPNDEQQNYESDQSGPTSATKKNKAAAAGCVSSVQQQKGRDAKRARTVV